jgi:homoserine O-acetyltransferase/O-succinyltransferase
MMRTSMASCNQSLPNLAECVSGTIELDSPFRLTFGQELLSAFVSYTLYGDLTKPLVLVLGGISADQYVADTNIEGIFVKGWWDPLVGYGKAIDLNRYCVLSFDYLDGQSGTLKCPLHQDINISTFDQATVINQLMNHLGIDCLAVAIGSSYGGMVALAFAEKYPDRVEQLIAICCNQKSDARNTAIRQLQRDILQFASAAGDNRQGLILARSLAMLGYRGAEELENRFPNQINFDNSEYDFPVVGYLKAQGEKFADRFCSQRFLNLSLSVDLHQIEPTNIKSTCLLLAIQGDLIAPPECISQLSKSIGLNASYSLIQSDVGHDGFLKEFEQISQLIKSRIGT